MRNIFFRNENGRIIYTLAHNVKASSCSSNFISAWKRTFSLELNFISVFFSGSCCLVCRLDLVVEDETIFPKRLSMNLNRNYEFIQLVNCSSLWTFSSSFRLKGSSPLGNVPKAWWCTKLCVVFLALLSSCLSWLIFIPSIWLAEFMNVTRRGRNCEPNEIPENVHYRSVDSTKFPGPFSALPGSSFRWKSIFIQMEEKGRAGLGRMKSKIDSNYLYWNDRKYDYLMEKYISTMCGAEIGWMTFR